MVPKCTCLAQARGLPWCRLALVFLLAWLPGGFAMCWRAGGQPTLAAEEGEPARLPSAKKPTGKSGEPKQPTRHVFSNVTRLSVFGVEGQGSTFVYVFDRSGSMSEYEGRPLAAAKSELLKSLQVLRPTHQFQIIFYNHEMAVFNPFRPQPPRLMFGDDTSKAQAEQFVRQIRAAGGTKHMEPLKQALRLAPDVIFFLTDAAEPEITARELAEIESLNRGTVINTIEFGVGAAAEGDNFMKKLARQNAGRHVYVDVTQLPRP
jgi:hypothetical protein